MHLSGYWVGKEEIEILGIWRRRDRIEGSRILPVRVDGISLPAIPVAAISEVEDVTRLCRLPVSICR
jgi:hypothetical protein